MPEVGACKDVPIIEVLVAPGDVSKAEDSLIALESEKAAMEVPSPQAGVVREPSGGPLGRSPGKGTKITRPAQQVEEAAAARGATKGK